MRMECSSLNSHLYKKNIFPDPSCQCGSFENNVFFSFVVLSIQLLETDTYQVTFIDTTPMTFCLEEIV